VNPKQRTWDSHLDRRSCNHALLAKEKRKLSAITGSAALRADAAESALCAYLSLVALAAWSQRDLAPWVADPIAALVIVPLILREGWEAMRGKLVVLADLDDFALK